VQGSRKGEVWETLHKFEDTRYREYEWTQLAVPVKESERRFRWFRVRVWTRRKSTECVRVCVLVVVCVCVLMVLCVCLLLVLCVCLLLVLCMYVASGVCVCC